MVPWSYDSMHHLPRIAQVELPVHRVMDEPGSVSLPALFLMGLCLFYEKQNSHGLLQRSRHWFPAQQAEVVCCSQRFLPLSPSLLWLLIPIPQHFPPLCPWFCGCTMNWPKLKVSSFSSSLHPFYSPSWFPALVEPKVVPDLVTSCNEPQFRGWAIPRDCSATA